MGKFIFEMPDDMTTSVEAFRVARGHKSTAQAVRELISTGLERAGPMPRTIRVQVDPKTIVDRTPLVSSAENMAAVAKLGIPATKSWPLDVREEPETPTASVLPLGQIRRATPKKAK